MCTVVKWNLFLTKTKLKKHNNKIDTQISISFSTIIIFLNYFPQYKVAEPWGCIELEMDRKMPVLLFFGSRKLRECQYCHVQIN